MVVIAMTADGIVRLAGARKGETGVGLTSVLHGDGKYYRFHLESEAEVQDFAFRRNAWKNHGADRGYSPTNPEFSDDESVPLVEGFYAHFWKHGLKGLHFEAHGPGWGGPHQVIIGNLDVDGSLRFAGELQNRSFIGLSMNLRNSGGVERFLPIASEQEAKSFALGGNPPKGASRISLMKPLGEIDAFALSAQRGCRGRPVS